ncbi:MAG: PH domain-containing protein [Acidobacteriota bacterium]|nr:PH domain-containing protein [Acidobacteriota bacterium]
MAVTRRPHPNLLKYFAIESLILGPLFPLVLLPRFFRFRTLRYEMDDRGITARWGVFFRREISLDYKRIQDIHLASNMIERWLGLGRVQLQTAAGSAKAELTIEGLQDYEQVRDFLYTRMLGAAGDAATGARGSDEHTEQVIGALREATAELRALRHELAENRSTSDRPAPLSETEG